MTDLSDAPSIFKREEQYGAQNLDGLPLVVTKAKGIYLWDLEEKRYLDFTSAFSAVNQGHCHPKIIDALKKQADLITLTSRAFYSPTFGEYAQYITKTFGYDKVLAVSSGVEAGDMACKISRRWGYLTKKIPNNQAKIVFPEGNYWGRTLTAISTSTDLVCKDFYGPRMPGFIVIPYNNLEALEKVLKEDPTICAFMMEPVQGEGGIIVPFPGYLQGVRKLCTQYNVLWIADEVQTGMGRTGKLLAVHHENVRPDIICLGKSLSGGVTPISAVLADDSTMLCLQPGEHGSTFGGNPLACKVAIEAIKVTIEERLPENAFRLGGILKKELEKLPKAIIKEVRGKGLMYALQIQEGIGVTSTDICLKLRDKGLIALRLYDHMIRLAPPLVITEEQLMEGIKIVTDTINSFMVR